MRRPLIAANWKMNGNRDTGMALSRALAERIAGSPVTAPQILICPPAPLIPLVLALTETSGVAVGGQDCHMAVEGAHTGDTSAFLLSSLGCGYVIVGHSERRTDHGETDDMVRAKAKTAQDAGLTPIVCIGETEAQREAGETLKVLASQIKGSIPEGATAANTVVAYEPVWAIGTGKTPNIRDITQAHSVIRKEAHEVLSGGAANLRILYGGSVKPSNAQEILAVDGVDGALVGGASLKLDDFWQIVQACP